MARVSWGLERCRRCSSRAAAPGVIRAVAYSTWSGAVRAAARSLDAGAVQAAENGRRDLARRGYQLTHSTGGI